MTLERTVLIADDDPETVRALAVHCRNLGLNVDTAKSGVISMLRARKNPPNLMIVDIGMPESDGFKECMRLLELHMAFPVIVLTGRSDAETIRRCEALGAHNVLKENNMRDKLEPLISRLLQSNSPADPGENREAASREDTLTPTAAPTVLAIDDDPGITKAIKIRLRYHGVETLEATNGMQAYLIALDRSPDVIITDYSMPGGSGDYLMVRLSQNKKTRSIPVIVLTGQTLDGQEDPALKRDLLGRCNASAFLAKPLDFDVLLAELERHITLKPIPTPAAKAL